VQHGDPLRLARVEKANSFDIYEIQLLQIQSYCWSVTLDLRLHVIKLFSSKLPAQPNPRSAFTRNPFNLQSHRLWFKAHSCECNDWAIHNSLHALDLEVLPILNFEEFLFGEKNGVD
jgi:hypothetical protein